MRAGEGEGATQCVSALVGGEGAQQAEADVVSIVVVSLRSAGGGQSS